MEINHISFSYTGGQNQLQAVSGRIPDAKITTIIGPNGCGKSTLLGALSSNYKPHSGHILLDGKHLASYKVKELARRLAVVHQHNEAPDDLTVEQIARFGRMPYRSLLTPRTLEDEEAVEWALTQTNLLDKRSRRLDRLSGGERQRVWLAMAIAQRTPMLFLDEPTTYLDMYYQLEILELIRSLNKQHRLTIVMVLHDINQAIRYSDELIVMKSGEAVMQGPPQQVITAELVKSIYGVEVIVRDDPAAGMHIIPIGI